MSSSYSFRAIEASVVLPLASIGIHPRRMAALSLYPFEPVEVCSAEHNQHRTCLLPHPEGSLNEGDALVNSWVSSLLGRSLLLNKIQAAVPPAHHLLFDRPPSNLPPSLIVKKTLGLIVSRHSSIVVSYMGETIVLRVSGVSPTCERVMITEKTLVSYSVEPSSESTSLELPKDVIFKKELDDLFTLVVSSNSGETTFGIRGVSGVLIVGQSGSGKTFFAKALANRLKTAFSPNSSDSFLEELTGDDIVSDLSMGEELAATSPTALALSKLRSGAVTGCLLLDGLEVLLSGESTESSQESEQGDRPGRLSGVGEKFFNLLHQTTPSEHGPRPMRRVLVIGTSASSHFSTVRRLLFQRVLNLPLPDRPARALLLKQWLPAPSPDSHETLIERLSQQTAGYLPSDLKRLVFSSWVSSRVRTSQSSGTLSDSGLGGLIWKDLEDGLKRVRPESLQGQDWRLPEVHWEEVGGCQAAKLLLRELVEWPLTYESHCARLGLQPASGLLLAGPPGCGKTLLVCALASKLLTNFTYVKAASLISHYLGQTELNLRKLFTKARAAAPCILFFDEFDAIARRRGPATDRDNNSSERLVAQLLNEMGGIEGSARGRVFVVACSNRVDLIDPALLRPGRIDQQVHVGLPNYDERTDILSVLTRKTPLAPEVNIKDIATRTNNYSGADLAAVVREAAMSAVRANAECRCLAPKDFECALALVKPATRKD